MAPMATEILWGILWGGISIFSFPFRVLKHQSIILPLKKKMMFLGR